MAGAKTDRLLVKFVGAGDELGEVFGGDVVVLHFAGEVAVVCAHVHEAVTGKVEEDGLLFTGFLALGPPGWWRQWRGSFPGRG